MIMANTLRGKKCPNKKGEKLLMGWRGWGGWVVKGTNLVRLTEMVTSRRR